MPSLPLRIPFDGEPAKRSADGRTAEPLHDVSLSSGRTDASELSLSPEFEKGFRGVCSKINGDPIDGLKCGPNNRTIDDIEMYVSEFVSQ